MSCNTKIAKLEKKLEDSKDKIRSKSEEIKKLKGSLRWMEKSRDDWKAKNKDKTRNIKNLKAKIDRRDKVPRHHYSTDIVELCIKLRKEAGCSFRSIAKALMVINICFNLRLPKTPCANSIENWVSKVGLFQLENAGNNLETNEVCLIVDEYCGVGNEKLLKILACPSVKKGNKALSFEDVHVCYMATAKSWNSEKIKTAINYVAKKNGFIVKYILSDEASVFKCSARMLEVPHLPDIAHTLATCLRKTFEKNPDYRAFIKDVAGFQAKSVNQDLTKYRPPKQRSKARFMNQKPMVEWAIHVINNFDKLEAKAKDFFKDLFKHKEIIEVLKICINIVNEINLIFKTAGLSKETFYKALEVVKKTEGKKGTNRYFSHTEYEPNHVLVKTFISLVYSLLSKYNAFTGGEESSLHVSSDIIESMFGKLKKISSNDPLVGLSILNLELAMYSIKDEDFRCELKNALKDVYLSDLSNWRESHSAENQSVKRNLFFKKSA